jgi:capsular exopolysaccharide synthesis family protein
MSTARLQNEPTSPSDSFLLDVFGLVRRKFWLLTFFVLLGIGFAVLAYLKLPKTFESTAKVFVDDGPTPTLNTTDGSSLAAEVSASKYAEIVKSELVIKAAIESAKLDEFTSLLESENVLETIKENLSVKSDLKSNSDVLKLSYKGPDPVECQQILQAIVVAFDRYIISTKENVGGDILTTLNEVTTKMASRFTELELEIQKISTNPNLMFRDGIVQNQHQLQQFKLQEDLDLLMREQTRMVARLEILERARAAGSATDSMAIEAIREMSDGALGAYVMAYEKFIGLKVREQELISEYGNDHPTLVALRNQIEMIDKMRMQELAALRGNAKNNDGPIDFVGIVTSQIKNRMELNLSEQQNIKNEMIEEQKKSQGIMQDVEKLKSLQGEHDRLRTAHDAAVQRLNEYSALKDHNWRKMSVLDEPSIAKQSSPNPVICLIAGLFLGSMAGFGIAALKEMAEKTFHSSDQISQQLGTKVIAHVPQFNDRIPKESSYKRVSGDVIALHRTSSVQAESYRSIRTSLLFLAQNTKAKVIQITSPSPGDGKSTTAANLAVVIAQSGKKVLLIDCDFRRPSQHTRFGLKNDVGVTSYLVGDVGLNEVIQEIGLENFHLITSGPIFSNPSELLLSRHLPEIINQMRDEFDFIIVDSPPVLPVTDPCIIAGFVDAVYMPMRLRNGVQINARRAIEALETVGRNVEGVIVNGLMRKDSVNYRYGDRYGSSYTKYGGVYGDIPKGRRGGKVNTARLVVPDVEITPKRVDVG